jgi:hypothetical protein
MQLTRDPQALTTISITVDLIKRLRVPELSLGPLVQKIIYLFIHLMMGYSVELVTLRRLLNR